MITRKEIDSMDPNMFVPWFIMASYGYYVLGRNVMDDEDFDYLTSRLIDCFDQIEHYHKHLINKEDLSSYSGFNLEYPTIAKHATLSYLMKNNL